MSDSAKCGLSAMQDPRRTELGAMRELAGELAVALQDMSNAISDTEKALGRPLNLIIHVNAITAARLLDRASSAGLLP